MFTLTPVPATNFPPTLCAVGRALLLSLLFPAFAVPDTPGIGVEVNEEMAKRQAFKYWEAPHWHRRDGSYTNW